jgi:endoplasmic reticulum chaperone BiP
VCVPALAAAGASIGPLLDAIHSSVGLQVYDLWPVDVGPIHSSLLVPPLLAAFYVTLASLDAALEGGRSVSSSPPLPSPPLAASYLSLAAGLALSATLHAQETVPPPTIAACLAAFTAANWWLFDRTGRGLALALLCAVVAPLAEAELMELCGSWHYPRADVSVPALFPSGLPAVGFVSWVPFCYAFYAPAVLSLGRRLRARARSEAAVEGGGGGGTRR